MNWIIIGKYIELTDSIIEENTYYEINIFIKRSIFTSLERVLNFKYWIFQE